MKIALVHDYLREYGGAERVVETLHEIWPDAPLYTSFVDWDALGEHAARFTDWDIRTSWVQNNWLVKKYHSPLRFLAPKIWDSIDLSDYDVVLSSSGWFMCRGVKTKISNLKSQISKNQAQDSKIQNPKSKIEKQGAIHICYIHHPPRNLYGYATGSTLQKYPLVKAYTTVVNFFLRHYDFETAQNVDYFIANSAETARRVKKFYRRESKVIYPPIEVSSIKYQVLSIKKKKENAYYLSVGRLTYSKRIDLAILACNQLNVPLKIVGVGKEEASLRALAGPTIEFLGGVSDEALDGLYRGAHALLFCALDEDFGMVPVESLARGTPVLALAQGGVKETIVDGVTGVFFEKPEVESLIQAMNLFAAKKQDWSNACVKHAQKFSKERFVKEITGIVAERWEEARAVDHKGVRTMEKKN